MLTLFWLIFWGGLSALVIAAGVSLRTRRREAIGSRVPIVDDAAVEEILSTGRLTIADAELDELELMIEPDAGGELDLQEIDDEEERFWSESWDEPTEW